MQPKTVIHAGQQSQIETFVDKNTGKSPLQSSSLCQYIEQERRSLHQILDFQILYHPEQRRDKPISLLHKKTRQNIHKINKKNAFSYKKISMEFHEMFRKIKRNGI